MHKWSKLPIREC